MNNTIRIKPHHFIDIITSFAVDKVLLEPHPYGHNVYSVSKKILTDRNVVLEIELHDDDICSPCIHNINGICDDTIDTANRPQAPTLKREWNLLIDNRWCERLKIKHGDKISALKFCELINENTNNILEIYKEVNKEHTVNRELNLRKGLKKYLASNVEFVDNRTIGRS